MRDVRVFDLHCDTLDDLARPTLPDGLVGSVGRRPGTGHTETGELRDFADAPGHLSLERMSAFSWCQCLAVFVPDPLSVEQSARFFDAVASTLPRHVAAHPDMLRVVRDAREVDGVLESGRTCGLLTIENGKLLAADPRMVDHVARLGVKMVALTWNAANPLGSGHDTEQGLTNLGVRTVGALEDRRIVVDVSHLNDPGFADVLACARRPFVASHSNSRAVCDVPRNLTDDQFRAIRDAGGIVGLNFCRRFVSTQREDPTPEDLIAHVEHWLDLDGADAVALGSDYDGCRTPSWLEPCDRMSLLASLLGEAFGSTLAEKVMFGNAHAFFERNEAS